MAERRNGNLGNSEAEDLPRRRAKKGLFCFSCGKSGHVNEDCPQAPQVTGEQSREMPSNQSEESVPASPEDSFTSNETERPASSSASRVETAPPITYHRAPGKKPKGTKPASHEVLEKFYKTGEQSRNPVGENFANFSNEAVKLSDESFKDSNLQTFDDFDLHEDILEMVKKMGLETPLPVQKYAYSIIKSGKNLKASAGTGSGKTAAFLLPILDNIYRHDARVEKKLPQYPTAYIMSPTRELAQQIYSDATEFAARTSLKICVSHGEALLYSEINKIKSGIHLLIGTLGRTLHHLRSETVKLDKLRYLVFDEADRLLKDDFAEEMEEFMEFLRKADCNPQVLMFSATFPEGIMHKIDRLFADNVFLRVGILGTVNEAIQQNVILVHESEKNEKLLEIIRQEEASKVKTLVFVRSKERAEMLDQFFFENKIRVALLHSDRGQYDRTKALRDLNDGRRNVMVATLVGSRGLDVNLVNHVINYDLPATIDDYINCLGRTGRVGNSGRATSFFDPYHRDDKAIAVDLRRKLADAGVTEIPDFLIDY